MAIRRLAALVTVAVVLVVAADPLAGQLSDEYTWTADRPDAVAPLGVSGDRTYGTGELSLSYRFMAMAFEGHHIGVSPVPLARVLEVFFLAPSRREVTMHLFGAAYGLHDRATLEVVLPFLVSKIAEGETSDRQPYTYSVGLWGDEDRAGFGDTEVLGHLEVYDEGPYRAHLTAGLSIPTGSYYQTAVTPLSAPDEQRLGYPMQIGSGTWDVLPGFTFWAMNERASTGIQANAKLRLHDNELGYNLGHRVEGSVWGGFRASDFIGVSARIHAVRTMTVQGADAALSPLANPEEHPSLQGGTRVAVPLGLNVYFPEGLLEGHRLAFEGSLPVYQDLHGPQLAHDWTFTVGWEWAPGMGEDG